MPRRAWSSLPLIVLAMVIWVFLKTNGGLALTSPAPVEGLTFERTVLEPGKIILTVRNAGPQELHLAQAVVNDGVWPFKASPSADIPRLGTAKVEIDYAWNYAEAYDVTLFSSNSIAFNTQIPVAFQTPELGGGTLLSFTLIGLYVGVIPVFLGFFWLPALRRLGKRWMTFLLAVTAGLLIFLGVDTLVEGLELVPRIAGALQGSGLIAIGVVVSFALLFAISRRQSGIGRSETDQRLSLAYMIALGIGVHNLGEGLAIGAAYSIGEIALGSFLVIGFIIQNITEGLGIIAPLARDRPTLRNLLLLGLLGGGPAIIGAWIGGFAPSPVMALFFLAIGTGAIFEVVYELGGLIRKDTARQPMPFMVFSGVTVGMLLLWVTGLLVK